jgi:sulfate adenylyltransferase large subunit
MEQLKFIIVGHVDHGKSTLIGRLLFDTKTLAPDKVTEVEEASKNLGRDTEFAFLMDHLREEREQGITIDTAQAFFKTNEREYVIIDAPGHREFMKNMITGASQAEAAILVVDVSQCLKEQTRRHAYILEMLGIEQVVVVLNKMDLVGFVQEQFNQVRDETKEFLESIDIKTKFFIPISATRGDNVAQKSKNMSWYSGPTALESLDFLKNKVSKKNEALIFPVQDIYQVDNKRIIVGRIESGVIKVGQEIKTLPQGRIAKVKSIEKFLEKTNLCSAGESIGITISESIFLERGSVICQADKELPMVDTFSANIFWLAKEDLDSTESLTLKCATQQTSCKVEKIVKRINSSTLESIEENVARLRTLEVGEVIIKLKKPIVTKRFNELEELGRFVLVKNGDTCAGGIIIMMHC